MIYKIIPTTKGFLAPEESVIKSGDEISTLLFGIFTDVAFSIYPKIYIQVLNYKWIRGIRYV